MSKDQVDGESAPMDYAGLIFRASYTYMIAGQNDNGAGKTRFRGGVRPMWLQ